MGGWVDGKWNPFKDNKSIDEIFCHDLLEQVVDDNGGKELEDLSQLVEYLTTIWQGAYEKENIKEKTNNFNTFRVAVLKKLGSFDPLPPVCNWVYQNHKPTLPKIINVW